jgi:hypothetical protein
MDSLVVFYRYFSNSALHVAEKAADIRHLHFYIPVGHYLTLSSLIIVKTLSTSIIQILNLVLVLSLCQIYSQISQKQPLLEVCFGFRGAGFLPLFSAMCSAR